MARVYNGNKAKATRDMIIISLVVVASITLGLLIAYAGS